MNGQPGTAQPGEGTGAESLSAEVAAAAKLLSGASDVTLLAHVNPDADALGSALALGRALRGRGARVRVSFGHPGAVPRSLRVLDPDGLIVPADEVPAAPPLLVVCDAGSLQRLGRWRAECGPPSTPAAPCSTSTTTWRTPGSAPTT